MAVGAAAVATATLVTVQLGGSDGPGGPRVLPRVLESNVVPAAPARRPEAIAAVTPGDVALRRFSEGRADRAAVAQPVALRTKADLAPAPVTAPSGPSRTERAAAPPARRPQVRPELVPEEAAPPVTEPPEPPLFDALPWPAEELAEPVAEAVAPPESESPSPVVDAIRPILEVLVPTL